MVLPKENAYFFMPINITPQSIDIYEISLLKMEEWVKI